MLDKKGLSLSIVKGNKEFNLSTESKKKIKNRTHRNTSEFAMVAIKFKFF